jgi:hypothetical protein
VGRWAKAGEDLGELCLTISRDAGDADDFSRPHVEAHPAQGRQTALVATPEVILPGAGTATTRICTAIDGRRFLRLFKHAIARYERAAAR